MKDKKQVLNFGGGTQSCAITALIIQGKLPKPDFMLIADTGREVQSTWDYLDQVVNPALKSINMQVERISSKDWGYGGIDIFQSGDLIIPAYTTEGHAIGKLSNFCNRWWKQDALKRWMSSKYGVTRSKYRAWVGFSIDEPKRYHRMMNGEEYKKGLFYLPLVDLRILRYQCIKICKDMGWPDPPRSRCWMCPNQRDEEWRELKAKSPDQFKLAVDFETDLQSKDPEAWLHKSCKPLGKVDFSEPPNLFNDTPCDSGSCFL